MPCGCNNSSFASRDTSREFMRHLNGSMDDLRIYNRALRAGSAAVISHGTLIAITRLKALATFAPDRRQRYADERHHDPHQEHAFGSVEGIQQAEIRSRRYVRPLLWHLYCAVGNVPTDVEISGAALLALSR
jgi:hypothetical protein